ncbi:DUF3995 domain-containing protein [Ahrensia sp. 13_GOM-1096m]|uniref:DUF3995 domain-containing protein n=1 Tax=Ahrensia sp. 13_GOM-1096m TaxID=1380380 RepID=UPI00047A9B7F|nr:DUF3995 domain-containing protein [Ahrensia sp. 13_GOM-1096m]
MTTILVLFIFVVLAITALIHIYWALGGLWPGINEKTLSKTVIGSTGIKAMPPRWVTALVSVGIWGAAIWPMLWLNWIPHPLPNWIVTAGMFVLTAIFIIRGLGGLLPIARHMNSEEPFATLNLRYFSPLITLLGVMMFYLLFTN